MNRRDLFRFAVGGIVGAPAMLIGDKLAAGSVEYVTGVSEVIEPPKSDIREWGHFVDVQVLNEETDAHIRELVQKQVDFALQDYHRQMQRGAAFHAMRKA